MTMIRPNSTGASVLLAGLLACGGRFTKTEHFVAYGENGEANYYRITIEARGDFSEVDYRSGWYDAAAVDQLFGDLAAKQTLAAKAAQEKGDAALDALDKYLEELNAAELDQSKIDARKRAYEEAVAAVTGVTPVGTDRLDVSYYAGKKLVLILSSDPSAIIDAIKSRLQGQRITDAIRKRLEDDNRRKADTARKDLETTLDGIDGVVEALERAQTSLDGAPTRQAVRDALTQLDAEVESR